MVLAEFCHTFAILLFSSEIVLKISIANLDKFRFAHGFNRMMEMLRDVLVSKKEKQKEK